MSAEVNLAQAIDPKITMYTANENSPWVSSVVLFFYRRIVQDKARVTFREEVPAEPTPEQMALLREEAAVAAD